MGNKYNVGKKYKEGDKVMPQRFYENHIKDPIDKIGWVEDMNIFIGEICTIETVGHNNDTLAYSEPIYEVLYDDKSFYFPESALHEVVEKISPEEMINRFKTRIENILKQI